MRTGFWVRALWVGSLIAAEAFLVIGWPVHATENTPKWLVMLYQDADDEILEQDIFTDLNEAERVGSTNAVTIVAQLDRYPGGFDGDGDWTSTKRFLIQKDDDLHRINSPVLKDLGEANMADGATLVDFATWAIDTYPADKVVLILSDHGVGWPGGWLDDDPRPGDGLWLAELDEALGVIRARTGIGRFELVGLDACLMGHLEVYNALAPHARYVVASQETEPSIGWAYSAVLGELVTNPKMSTPKLAEHIVTSYIDDDQVLVDENARALFFMQQFYVLTKEGVEIIVSMDSDGLQQLVQEYEIPDAEGLKELLGVDTTTMAAIDLFALQRINAALDVLILTMADIDQAIVARARAYSQSFESVFGEEVPPSYLDLGHFARLLSSESENLQVQAAAEQLLEAIGEAVIAEKHGSAKPGATGISIYFPNAALYQQAHPATIPTPLSPTDLPTRPCGMIS